MVVSIFNGFCRPKRSFCPRCYQRETILYGHNPQGSQRVQCRSCKHVWTPKQQPLTTIVPPEQIATVPFNRPFSGACTDQKLYVLLSFDAIRGNILHISSNFTPHLVGDTLRYRWRNNVEPAVIHDNIVERVRQRETLFYAAASLMKSSTAVPCSNEMPMAQFYARSLPRTDISAY